MKSLSLSSLTWRVRDATRRGPWLPAVVPGCVHRDLERAGRITDPFSGTNELDLRWIEETDWEYRAILPADPSWREAEHVVLAADGLDTVATVRVNGRMVGTSDNMFIAHRWDLKRHLRAGRNEIAITFGSAMAYIRSHRRSHRPREINDPVGGCTILRKEQCQFGWDWGPRLVTAGIWRDLRVEAWDGRRLETVAVRQEHHRGGVRLHLAPELSPPANSSRGKKRRGNELLRVQYRLHGPDGTMIAGEGTEIVLPRPLLWWPRGQGDQPLYDLEVSVLAGTGVLAGTWRQRIGLRSIQLERRPDRWGESFRFVVNGRPVFAKGANWIPAHSFVAGLTREDYGRDLRSAAAAHLNMIRVWGGGIYESEAFYDWCDELGLLVWQDFMFACTRYPADAAFLGSVRREAACQIRRLRHRACLALWCGNNEVYGCNPDEMTRDPSAYPEYEALFHQTLPAAVAEHDPASSYWPSSPWRGDREVSHQAGEKRGDTHFWDVWHARHPVSDYRKWRFRFVSEFGMQSFSSPQTNASFVGPGADGNVFGPVMENHQKNRAGNQIILDYVSRRYRLPRDQDALIYLSQVNQAECMRIGVEHYRRLTPRCMGAIYWQLNDCWPATSWSSIEFTGRWKALHYLARRFYSPALATGHVDQEDEVIVGNYRRPAAAQVHLSTVFDGTEAMTARLRWDIFLVAGGQLKRGSALVRLRPGEARRWRTLRLDALAARHGRDRIGVRVRLEVKGAVASEDTLFLSAPRFLDLPRGRTQVALKRVDAASFRVRFVSTVFQHRFAFDLQAVGFAASDNYFELYPGEAKEITVKPEAPLTLAGFRQRLSFRSLVDTYPG